MIGYLFAAVMAIILLQRAAASSAFAVELQVTKAIFPWTLQTSGLHVYCTSARTKTQKYNLKLTHSLRCKGYGIGLMQKYKLGFNEA